MKSMLTKAGAEVIETAEGMVGVIESNKDTWPQPFLPVPAESQYQDLKAYTDRFTDDELKIEEIQQNFSNSTTW